jgi:hypothetical protein
MANTLDFNRKYGGDTFPRNVGNHAQDYMAQ